MTDDVNRRTFLGRTAAAATGAVALTSAAVSPAQAASFVYPATGTITSDYYDERSSGYHEAVDIANDKYTNIYSSRGGYHTQYYASGCGNYSVIDHGGGYETYYCHLNSWVAGNGTNVSDCQHIAEMGTTGNSTGDHVHFEIKYNGDNQYISGSEGDYVYACSTI